MLACHQPTRCAATSPDVLLHVREKKRANDYRAAAEEHRRRLEAALREQRSLVRKLGEAERSLGGSAAARSSARKAAAEQEYWSEEAGRRFAVQQEELVALREQNVALQQHMAAAVPADTAARYEASIKELQQLVHFYEQRLMAAGGAAAVGMDSMNAAGVSAPSADAEGCCGSWLLEMLNEGGACYLWERSTGRVMTDVPDGHWPRPVGGSTGLQDAVVLLCCGLHSHGGAGCAQLAWQCTWQPAMFTARPSLHAAKLKKSNACHCSRSWLKCSAPAELLATASCRCEGICQCKHTVGLQGSAGCSIQGSGRCCESSQSEPSACTQPDRRQQQWQQAG
jgi:hypothetical protein